MTIEQHRIPNFFIVGAPRCATTALYTYLRRHPEIFLPKYKEPHFFNTDMPSGGAIRNTDEYAKLFYGAEDRKRVGEASVYYLSSRAAPAGIKSFSPLAKIIIMLRNPVDVLHALHAMNVAGWIEDVWDFEEALRLEEQRKHGQRLPWCLKDVAKVLYRETVNFSRHVRTYLDYFGTSNVHVIIYDDFKKNTGKAFRDCCSFLDVSPTVTMEFPVIWANPSFRSRILAKWIQRPPTFLRRLGRLVVPRPVRARVVNRLWNLNRTRSARAPMPADLRQRLTNELAPEVGELSTLLGRDLSDWLDSSSRLNRPKSPAS
jgi:hypothetical protein